MSSQMVLEIAASSRGDFDTLDERPSRLRDALAASTALIEHQRDRVSDHCARLFKVLTLGVDFGELRDPRVHPAVASVLKDGVEGVVTHPVYGSDSRTADGGDLAGIRSMD